MYRHLGEERLADPNWWHDAETLKHARAFAVPRRRLGPTPHMEL